MDVLKLLQSKNRCLRRLLDLSCRFLEAGDMDQLESFQLRRDSVFKALDLYDRKVVETISLLPSSQRTPELAARVQEALQEKDRIVQAILLKDNELMLRIEEKKSKLLESIASSKKSQELVGKFKSSWVPESGEEIDQKL